jgi:Protein of unknown function (DUF2778)
MGFHAAIADRPLSRRRRGWSGIIVLTAAAVAAALGAAVWITHFDLSALASAALPANPDRVASFEDRFFPASIPEPAVGRTALQPMDRAALDETRLRAAKNLLAPQLMSLGFRGGFVEASLGDLRFNDANASLGDSRFNDANAKLVEGRIDEAKPAATTGIPLPRSRPAAANLEPPPGSAQALADAAPRSDDRTLMQKLSDLIPGRIKLASLTPEGLFHRGPDLAALGYDATTAVYDISAHAVYMPSGLTLEAHSGIGGLRDDPEHVSVPNLGATPPATYDLKPREASFHGVSALRMTPVEGSDINGRSGLLVHSFMLGVNGDSNGCVSIREYERFLKAFNDGQVNRLVVVPSLSGTTLASQT